MPKTTMLSDNSPRTPVLPRSHGKPQVVLLLVDSMSLVGVF
jgi:hypothetical protein